MGKFIGDKAFYKRVLTVILPLIIQNTITQFVSLLDNVMVGQCGNEAMSGVSIANNLFFVYNLCIFGGFSGPGIFCSQYYGQKNDNGVRHTFRFKLMLGAILCTLGLAILIPFGPSLVKLYLTEDGITNVALTYQNSLSYMRIILISLLPFALSQAYCSTLRETGETKLPMIASLTAIFTNLVLNYILIYGKLGLPALGVSGAAIATVVSRFVELGVVLAFSYSRKSLYPFLIGAFKSFKIPAPLLKKIILKGFPLLLNETLWSTGMAILNQCYSTRGLNVVAAQNISGTIFNLFFMATMAMGNGIAILVGQDLGSGNKQLAKQTDYRIFATSIMMTIVLGLMLVSVAHLLPQIYKTTEDVRKMATTFLYISACFMPVNAFNHCAYFTMRTGGKTVITFLLDTGYTWVVGVPLALILSHFTNLEVIPMFILIESANIIKALVGFFLVKSGIWANNIVDDIAEV